MSVKRQTRFQHQHHAEETLLQLLPACWFSWPKHWWCSCPEDELTANLWPVIKQIVNNVSIARVRTRLRCDQYKFTSALIPSLASISAAWKPTELNHKCKGGKEKGEGRESLAANQRLYKQELKEVPIKYTFYILSYADKIKETCQQISTHKPQIKGNSIKEMSNWQANH